MWTGPPQSEWHKKVDNCGCIMKPYLCDMICEFLWKPCELAFHYPQSLITVYLSRRYVLMNLKYSDHHPGMASPIHWETYTYVIAVQKLSRTMCVPSHTKLNLCFGMSLTHSTLHCTSIWRINSACSIIRTVTHCSKIKTINEPKHGLWQTLASKAMEFSTRMAANCISLRT